jgi:hypothetical protein
MTKAHTIAPKPSANANFASSVGLHVARSGFRGNQDELQKDNDNSPHIGVSL